MHVANWHGGTPGIGVGEYIESPYTRRNQLSLRQREKEAVYRGSGLNKLRDQKRVYFTSDRELARAWAVVGCGGGTLYRVRPVPPSSLEVDPDYPDGGFSARRAEVLDVVETTIAMSDDQAHHIASRHQTWSDLSPMYDEVWVPTTAARASKSRQDTGRLPAFRAVVPADRPTQA
ncbi:MAG: hypothetical protein QOF92_933 [Pseudonocardiales bacterium]|nr:hypothetical protein [Pseudonocardiales bacterium]MDT4928066.1 hypothetical protein [Pseudonocardiales bacterium]